MSVRYSQYVLPEPDYMLFRPTRAQLRGILDALSELGWLRPEDALTASERRLYTSSSQVSTRLALPTTDLLHLWLAGGPPGRYPDEFVAGDVFGPSYCEDIAIIESPVLALLPAGMDGAEILCTSCSSDMYPAISLERPQLRKLSSMTLAPERCPSCHQPVDLNRTVMQFGMGRSDPAPFAHLILEFQAVHAPDEHVQLPADLLTMLARKCGVPFREASRFQ